MGSIGEVVGKTIKRIDSGSIEAEAIYEADASGDMGETISKIRIRNHSFASDVNTALGGKDHAPCPAEYLLGALAACIRTSYVIHASLMEVDFESIEVRVSGMGDRRGTFGLDEKIPSGFQKLEYKITIATGEPEEKIKKLLEFVDRHCHVLNTLRRPLNMKGQFELKSVA